MRLKDVKKYFNNAKKTYNDNCFIQYKVGCYLIDKLKSYNFNFNEIIDLGCGTGLITNKLAELYCNSQKIYAIDISIDLLKEAPKNFKISKIIFREDNFDRLSSYFRGKKFDLIFSNMALQWSRNLEKTIINLREKLSNHGILAFSITLPETFKELKGIKKIPLFSAKNLEEILRINGMDLIKYENLKEIYNYNSFRDAIKSIKLVGANYSENKLGNMVAIRHLIKAENMSNEKKFSISYDIGIFLVKKTINA